MPGIDMTQMVRRTVQPADSGASAVREQSDSQQSAGFLQLLRKKQQAAAGREESEKLVRDDESQDKTSGQKPAQSQPEAGEAGDLHAEINLQAQTTAKNLQGEWPLRFAGSQEPGIRMVVQGMNSPAETVDSAGEQAGQEVQAVSPENALSVNGLSENVLSENILPENSLLGDASSEDSASLFQEKLADGQMAQAVSEELPKPSSKEDLPKAVLSKIPAAEHQEQVMEDAPRIYEPENAGDGQQEPIAEIPQKMILQESSQKPALQEAEMPAGDRAFSVQAQGSNVRQNKNDVGDEVPPDKVMHPQQTTPYEPSVVQSRTKTEIPVKTTEAELPADLGKALADRLPPDDGTLTIELEPASLGKVTIKVIYETGRASISLMSANPKTLEILNQNAGEIAGILADKTGRETMIYTYQPEQEFADSREGGGQEHREPQEQRDHRKREQPDSFVQQLRLGLV